MSGDFVSNSGSRWFKKSPNRDRVTFSAVYDSIVTMDSTALCIVASGIVYRDARIRYENSNTGAYVEVLVKTRGWTKDGANLSKTTVEEVARSASLVAGDIYTGERNPDFITPTSFKCSDGFGRSVFLTYENPIAFSEFSRPLYKALEEHPYSNFFTDGTVNTTSLSYDADDGVIVTGSDYDNRIPTGYSSAVLVYGITIASINTVVDGFTMRSLRFSGSTNPIPPAVRRIGLVKIGSFYAFWDVNYFTFFISKKRTRGIEHIWTTKNEVGLRNSVGSTISELECVPSAGNVINAPEINLVQYPPGMELLPRAFCSVRFAHPHSIMYLATIQPSCFTP